MVGDRPDSRYSLSARSRPIDISCSAASILARLSRSRVMAGVGSTGFRKRTTMRGTLSSRDPISRSTSRLVAIAISGAFFTSLNRLRPSGVSNTTARLARLWRLNNGDQPAQTRKARASSTESAAMVSGSDDVPFSQLSICAA